MRALIASAALGLLPGLLISACTHPSAKELRSSERLLVALLYSLGVLAFGGLALVGFGALRPLPCALLLASTCGVALFIARARGCSARALLARAHTDLMSTEGGLATLVVVGTLLAHAIRLWLAPWSSPHPAWNYLGDVQAMLAVGGLPESTLDYGVPFAFESNKIVWYLALAQTIALGGLGDAPWSLVHGVTIATSGAVALALWVWARDLAQRPWVAFAVAVSVLWLPRMVYKLAGLRGESLGLALLFALLWALQRVLRESDLRNIGVAALAAALLGGVHLVPALSALLWSSAFFVGWLVCGKGRRGPAIARLAAAGALGALLFAVIQLSTPATPLDTQAGIARPETSRGYRGLDPSHAFRTLVFEGELDNEVRRFHPYESGAALRFYTAPSALFKQLGKRSALPLPGWPQASLPLALLMLAFFAAARFGSSTREGRALLCAVPLFAGLLFALGLFFSARYNTHLPAEHPKRREFPYLQLLYAAAVPLALEAVARSRVASGNADENPSPWVSDLLALGCAGIAVPILWAGVHELRSPRGSVTLHPSGRAALDWLRTATPTDVRVLTDGSTVGLLGALTERVSVTEGRAPYFQPENLALANDTLAGARAFFRAPLSEAGLRYLREQRIDLILTGSQALGARAFAKQPLRLPSNAESQRRFPPMARFGPVIIRRVVDAAPATPE